MYSKQTAQQITFRVCSKFISRPFITAVNPLCKENKDYREEKKEKKLDSHLIDIISMHTCTHRHIPKHNVDAYAVKLPKAFTSFNERQESHVSAMHGRGTLGLALFPSIQGIYPCITSIPVSYAG